MSSVYSISPVTVSDLPALTQISRDAWTKDRHTLMKARCAGYDHAAGMSDALTHWLSIPTRYTIVKATEVQSNEITGFVCWGFSGYNAPAKHVPEEKAEHQRGQTDTSAKAGHTSESDTSGAQAEPMSLSSLSEPSSVERLAAITDQDMTRWQKILCPKDTRVMFVISITVAPIYQSRGVGSKLIRWGIERADADGARCWVHVSEDGYNAFERNGFSEVGRLDVDLDQYATAPPGMGEVVTDRKWGNYIFRYMVRPPKSS